MEVSFTVLTKWFYLEPSVAVPDKRVTSVEVRQVHQLPEAPTRVASADWFTEGKTIFDHKWAKRMYTVQGIGRWTNESCVIIFCDFINWVEEIWYNNNVRLHFSGLLVMIIIIILQQRKNNYKVYMNAITLRRILRDMYDLASWSLANRIDCLLDFRYSVWAIIVLWWYSHPSRTSWNDIIIGCVSPSQRNSFGHFSVMFCEKNLRGIV